MRTRGAAATALLLLSACRADITGLEPGEAYQRFLGAGSYCVWEIIPPPGYAVEGGRYTAETAAASWTKRLDSAQLEAIRAAERVTLFAPTREPWTAELVLELRADTTYDGIYPNLTCNREVGSGEG